MPARRGRYKQLMDVNSLGGATAKTTYADFLQERERGGKSEEGEELVYRPPPVAPHSSTGEPRRRGKTVVDVAVDTQQSLEGGEKMLKTIEDHMWLHRQEERDLRRTEMDIKRNQRQVERTLKKYEQDLEKQQKTETERLLEHQALLLQQQQQDQHERERVTKERKGVHQMLQSVLNEHGKEFVKKGGALSYQYRQLTDMLDQKRSEVDRMSKEFEAKLRAKEAEQYKIKQELASLAISLNMEAQKKRRAEVELRRDKEKSTARDIQADLARDSTRQKEVNAYQHSATKHEGRVAKLTQDLRTKQTETASKGRRHGRSLATVQSQLEGNRTNQRLSRMAQAEVEAELKGREMMERMERIDAQRQARQSSLQRQVRERNAAQLKTWEQNTATQLTEQERLKHQERVKQLQRLVTHLDSQEHSLYAQVKDAEAARRKQETVVDTLQGDLDTLKRDNAKRLKAAVVEAKKAELEIEQKIAKETAELTKALNLRQEGMRELAIHRSRAKEDKRMLMEEKKEQDRKTRIQQHSDMLTVS